MKKAATMIVVPGTGSGKWDWKGMPSSAVGGIGSIEKGMEGREGVICRRASSSLDDRLREFSSCNCDRALTDTE